MRKREGFTLVEIIISISLIAIIGVTVGISINKVFKSQTNNEQNNVISRIKSAADVYMSGNATLLNQLYTEKAYLYITIGELRKAGLLDENLKNPNTNEVLSDDTQIKISLDENGLIKYTYPITEDTTDKYLQALNVFLEKNEAVDCTIGKGTYNLVVVNPDKTYNVSETNTIITSSSCDWQATNSNTPGTYNVKYTYTLSDGVVRSTYRKFIVQNALVVTINSSGKGSNEWNISPFNLTAKLDRNANIKYNWKIDGINAGNTTNSIAVNTSGTRTYTLEYTVNNYNNTAVQAYTGSLTFIAKLELASDISKTMYTPTVSGSQVWSSNAVNVSVSSAAPISGIKNYNYCLTTMTGNCTPNSIVPTNKTITVSTLGQNKIQVTLVTNAGNTSNPGTGYAYFDNVNPSYQSGSYSGTFVANYTEAHSGIANKYFLTSSASSSPSTTASGWTTNTSVSTPSCGSYYYYFTYATDNAGNKSNVNSLGSNYGGTCCYGCQCTNSCYTYPPPPPAPVCDAACQIIQTSQWWQANCSGCSQAEFDAQVGNSLSHIGINSYQDVINARGDTYQYNPGGNCTYGLTC